MKFQIETWTIDKLIKTSDEGALNLMPPYQRNFIWSTKDQEDLIKSINKHYPLPTIFLNKKGEKFEVVDGQQRIRTILNHYQNNLILQAKNMFGENNKEDFLKYELAVTIISSEISEETIEDFYAKVNKSGLKLNKPELSKAENFDTRFLALNEELASNSEFKNLNLFTDATRLRMNDIDLVSELTTLIIRKGPFDKKIAVDQLYETDITEAQAQETKTAFLENVHVLSEFNNVYKLSKTRFRQRNDIYTLFQFVDFNKNLELDLLIRVYRALIIIGQRISPASDSCPPLREYARNCVTQSNSKDARSERFSILSKILLGDNGKTSSEQAEIIRYFKLTKECLIQLKGYKIFDYQKMEKVASYGNVI